MTIAFTDYLAKRPELAAALGGEDRILVMQGGKLKVADPQFTAVLTDKGGSGNRCQVQAVYAGKADDGVTDIWNMEVTTL